MVGLLFHTILLKDHEELVGAEDGVAIAVLAVVNVVQIHDLLLLRMYTDCFL
jgi:hypothetical protein